MKKIILYLLFTFCASSKKDPVISEFTSVVKLKGMYVPIQSAQLGEVVDMKIIGSLLILNEIYSDKIYKAFDINTGKMVQKCIDKGKGPNEVLYPGIIHVLNKNMFSQYDPGKKQLDFFSITNKKDSLIQFASSLKTTVISQLKIFPVNDSIVLNTGIYDQGRYCLYNLNSGKNKISGDYPKQGGISKLNNAMKAMIYQPTITIKPDKRKFASLEGMAGYMEISNINGYLIDKTFSKDYYTPLVKIVNGHQQFIRDNPYAFHSSASTDENIYTIYSGRSMNEFGAEYYAGNNLLVYDWNGSPVVNYQLDRFLKIMTLDPNKMLIYGFCTDPVTGEPEIIKYQLPQLPNDPDK